MEVFKGASTVSPSPLWGGVRGGGIPEWSGGGNPNRRRHGFPPSLALPHKGVGN